VRIKLSLKLKEPCIGTPDKIGPHEWRPYKKKWMVCTHCEQKKEASAQDQKRQTKLTTKQKEEKVNLDNY
jgi:hypothetical protein